MKSKLQLVALEVIFNSLLFGHGEHVDSSQMIEVLVPMSFELLSSHQFGAFFCQFPSNRTTLTISV